MKILETRYGLLEVPEAEQDLICRFLTRYGEWAFDEVRFVAAAMPNIRPLRVLDVGAFVGTFGIGLSQLTTVESTTYVEANPALQPLLRSNVERNGRGQFTVVEAAITPGGSALIGSYDEANLGSLSFTEPEGGARVQAPSPSRFASLSEIVTQSGSVDLIKMDVEGLEYSILSGNKSLLSPGGPAFWLECNNSRQSLDLVSLLLECGLPVHYFAFPSHDPDNFFGDSKAIFPWAYEAGLWASRGPAPSLTPELKRHGCILKRIESREQLRQALWQTPRWAPAAWQDASKAELVAEAAHLAAGERLAQFLVDPSVPVRIESASATDLAVQVKKAKLAQKKAEIESRSYRVLLEDAERQLAVAESLRQINSDLKMLARQGEVELARSNQETVEVRHQLVASELSLAQFRRELAEAREQHVASELRFQQIQRSPYWRVTRPLREFLARHPRVRQTLRKSIARVLRVVR